jgi:hypothetical protein
LLAFFFLFTFFLLQKKMLFLLRPTALLQKTTSGKASSIFCIGGKRQLSFQWISRYAFFASKEGVRKDILVHEILPALDEEDFHKKLSKEFSRTRGSLPASMLLRNDFQEMMNSKELDTLAKSKIKSFDKAIQAWLSCAFSLDNLELRRITFDESSGCVLEKVARGESVHRVRSLSELKRRLQEGKRCFGLFHPALPDEPLVFIHVGLTTQVSKSLAALDSMKTDENPSHAIFYSINSPLSALRK